MSAGMLGHSNTNGYINFPILEATSKLWSNTYGYINFPNLGATSKLQSHTYGYIMEVPYCGPKYIKCHHRKFNLLGDLTTRGCSSQVQHVFKIGIRQRRVVCFMRLNSYEGVPCTQWTGGWVGSDILVKTKFCYSLHIWHGRESHSYCQVYVLHCQQANAASWR
jgi:hypothetical protein